MAVDTLSSAAEQFKPESACKILDVREFGSGNINSTFLVTLKGCTDKHFMLQRINTRVFRKPELIMRNMRIATEHIRRHLERAPLAGGRRWEVPRVLSARDGRDHWIDDAGAFWRGLSFIEGRSFDTIRDSNHAEEAGYALGFFHKLLSDLSSESLVDTLEGFHIAPAYLRHYDEVLAKHGAPRSAEANYCKRFISRRAAWAHVLEDAKAKSELSLRPIHGDPKVNNILIDTSTGRAIGIVDLDTVKPGLVHYDIGDCLRSACNRLGEDADLEKVYFDPNICQAFLRGYIPVAREFLSASDFDYIYDAIRLIGFELGLRFFTDYLEGNVYFKIRSPEHNLFRALVQFKLTASIEAQEAIIHAIIQENK